MNSGDAIVLLYLDFSKTFTEFIDIIMDDEKCDKILIWCARLYGLNSSCQCELIQGRWSCPPWYFHQGLKKVFLLNW